MQKECHVAYHRMLYPEVPKATRDAAQRLLHLTLVLKEHPALPECPGTISVETPFVVRHIERFKFAGHILNGGRSKTMSTRPHLNMPMPDNDSQFAPTNHHQFF